MPAVAIASHADWQRVRTLRLAALRDTPDAFGSTFEDEVQRPPEWWIDRLQSSGSTTFIAIEPSESGMAVLGPFHSPPDCGVFAVWVAPEYRGLGVGDALMQSVIDQASCLGVGRLVLHVGRHNLPAQRLYLRHGFSFTGTGSTLPPPRSHILEDELELVLEASGPKP
ncbi:MAG: GNAT family N-acetyltransferase [Verrucomicrobiaceae bacterium]|nr:GNAT family N-acetyltransferase [Verrucomicrobiaceae bacterium]